MDDESAKIEGVTLVADFAALQWYEAVAVVLQLAESMLQAGEHWFPDLADVALSADGTVTLYDPASRPSAPPAAHLASVTKRLLKGPAPPELARLLTQAADETPPGQDIARLLESLRYFERPNRPLVLRQLVERLAPAEAEARVARELEKLEAKARGAAEAPPAPKEDALPKRRHRQLVMVALIVVAVALAGSALVWWRFGPPLTQAASGVRSVVTRTTSGIARTFNKGVERLFGERVQQQPDALVGVANRPKAASKARTAKAKSKDVANEPAGGTPGKAAELPLLPTTVLPQAVLTPPNEIVLVPPEIETPVTRADPASDRIYSAVDRDVTPPVPLQPFLGRPTSDTTGIGDMEVLVDERGNVARVTLLSPNTYGDRMLVYAMKARKFKPAMAGDRPVRYLLRIRTAF